MAWFSKFYLRVRSKKCGKNMFFCFSFQNCFEFWAIYFQTFGQNTSKVFKTIFCVSRGTICAFKFFFKSFEPLWNFCRNLWHGSQISIYVSRVKFAEEIIFFDLPFWNFSKFEQKFFRLLAKKLQEVLKTIFYVPEEQFVAWNSSAWFSKFYLRVQSKNFGRNSFLIFLFGIFSDFERNFFQTSVEKSSNKLSKLPSTCPAEKFVAWIFFFLGFKSFRIFCRNIWQGSQNSIHVSRVKIAEETVFYCFLSRIFSNYERKFFRLLTKKLQEFVKTIFCVSRGTICGLIFF